jgi:hypothetical protein
MKNYVLYMQTIPELLPPSSTPTEALIYYDGDGNKHILVYSGVVRCMVFHVVHVTSEIPSYKEKQERKSI